MAQVILSLPDQAGLALKLPPESLPGELLLAAAVKLHELGRLSARAAAELAGVPKPVFLSKLADYGVATFRQNATDLREELENA
jgi:predicted HTH domain antitoxin